MVVDAGTGTEVFCPARYSGIDRIRFSPKEMLLAVSGSAAADHRRSVVQIWDVGERKLSATLVQQKVSRYVASDLAFSPDGQRLAVAISNHGKHLVSGGTDGKITLWSTSTRKPVWSAAWRSGTGDCVYGVAVSPDGASVAVCGRGSGAAVQLYDLAQGTLQRSFGETNPVGNAVRFSPDGQRVTACFTTYGNLSQVAVIRTFPRGGASLTDPVEP